MRCHRIYLDSQIECGQTLQLPEPQSHHLGKVLRMQTGQFVHLFNGSGGYYRAEIIVMQKRAVSVLPGEFIADVTDTPVRINLAQGVSRGRHMDYTIQKAVELGVHRIIPLLTDYSNVNLSTEHRENKLAHWQSVIIGACEQSGRNILPELASPLSFDDWLPAGVDVPCLLLDPDADGSLATISPRPAVLTIVSGPEGGFSEREVAAARQNGCLAIRLGPRILRTETAAVAAITAVQTLWGDMG